LLSVQTLAPWMEAKPRSSGYRMKKYKSSWMVKENFRKEGMILFEISFERQAIV